MHVKEIIGRMAPPELVEGDDAPLPCGSPPIPTMPVPGVVYCDGKWHHRVMPPEETRGKHALISPCKWEMTGRCEGEKRSETRKRIDGERKRLAGEIALIAKRGGIKAGVPVFDGYSPESQPDDADRRTLDRALGCMRRFSAARPPTRNVILKGPNGLGKTRLMLSSHFALLEAGIASQYVTTPELRKWFKRAESFDEEMAREANDHLDRYVYAQVVHFDDVGHVENDQRARGQFTEGLKDLLDRSRATAWAVATNRSSNEMEMHPDLSGTIVSRIQYQADVVPMSGVDFRTLTAQEYVEEPAE